MAIPKDLGHKHFPAMGDQYEVGLTNVGFHAVTATIVVNSAMTNAQIVAAPPNTAATVPCGPIVHSLGAAPSAVIPILNGQYGATSGLAVDVAFSYITADNSAVYLRAMTWTGTTPRGASVTVFVIR